MSLDPEIADRIQKDFPDEQIASVTALLEESGTDFAEKRSDVQRAILELSNGDLDLLKHNVQVSKTDFRDVIYWAFGWENDPRRLLWEIRDQLKKDGILSDEDGASLGLIGSREGMPRELQRLCELVQYGEQSISASQLETLKKLVRRLRLPARLWKSLAD